MRAPVVTEGGARPGRAVSEEVFVGGAFDAASRTDRALLMWSPPLRSADQDIIPDKEMMDARARDVLRNDSYVRAGAQVHRDNIVGALYALNAKPAAKVLGRSFTEKWEEEFQEEVEARWSLWAESPENWPDAAGRNSFTELVRLAVGLHTASGEVLATAEWLRDSDRLFSTAIQMVDIDRLSTPPARMSDPRVQGGVERDSRGRPVYYHIRAAHPADWNRGGDNMVWRRVPARKPWGRPQVIHIFEQFRPEQSRGIAEMVSALKEIRITKKFRDVVLQNAVVNATFAAAIESDMPTADAFAALGAGDPIGGMESYVKGYLSQIAEYASNGKNLTLDGARIPHLFPGTKLHLHPAGKGGPLGQDFEKSLLRYIAASLGVSYEQLSRDYSSTNYSSARAAMSETWKRMSAVKRQVADRFASTVYRLWLEEAIQKGIITALPRAARVDGWLYEGQNFDAISKCEWIGASRGQIDELKETQAAVLRLRYNLTTEEHEIARLGMDWRAVKAQRAREVAMNRDLNLTTPDTVDAMMNAVDGSPRDSEGDAATTSRAASDPEDDE